LKFISANIGLIKTRLDNAMQESHLIRHSTGLLIPKLSIWPIFPIGSFDF
jgi:hypothetical protein